MRKRLLPSFGLLSLILSLSLSCTAQEKESPNTMLSEEEKASLETATFGAGCFWCVEAVFENLDGVKSVESGYMGGETENPTYREVSMGNTGHAEVTRIYYDPKVISYKTLLDWLWRSHDPTTLNRQGADVGTQYRSAIFYHSDEQREIAEASKETAQSMFDSPIVTEITAASEFYIAEDYHQDYYKLNKSAPYCQMVIRPKLKKLDLE
ncbi:peptide-methionine (S)-S-oxide reductase MsrA [Coraliomargarita sinensis]|nr:peptide-methionine (S)-S-oxide reductase MsrA [Coraliomargarita sinensis]